MVSNTEFSASDYHDVCMQRLEVIKLIPEVRPRKALEAFNDLFSHHVGFLEYVDGPPIQTNEDDWDGAFHDGDAYERSVITPHGAKILMRLFEVGAISQMKKSSSKDLSALQAYVDSEPDLIERAKQKRVERDAAREAQDAEWRALNDRAAFLAQNPDDASPEEMSETLIDRIFIKKDGYGVGGSMKLGDCVVHKELDHYVSNSGQTRNVTARVWWVDKNGVTHGDPNPPKPNRRSDPDRNWGLGRG